MVIASVSHAYGQVSLDVQDYIGLGLQHIYMWIEVRTSSPLGDKLRRWETGFAVGRP